MRKNPFSQLQLTTYNANCSVDSYSESSSPADNLESFDYFGLEIAHLALYKSVAKHMIKLPQMLVFIIIAFSLVNCERKSELTDVEFEKKVFYNIFSELSDQMYSDIRLTPKPPPPSPKYLAEKGFDAESDYNKAKENWEKSTDYREKVNDWRKRRDSILNDTTLIYIAFPDSISQFQQESIYQLKNHFNEQKLVIGSENFDLKGKFNVDFDKIKSSNKKLRFKPISEFPKGDKFWTTDYNFNFQGTLSASRILFDKTESFGLLNASFVSGRLNGNGFLIFIKKDRNGNWLIDKIEPTWIS